MKIDLRQIKSEGTLLPFSELAQDIELNAEGFEFSETIQVDMMASKSGDEIIIQARIATLVEMECSRCLDIYEDKLNAKLQFVIQLLEIVKPQTSEDDDFVMLPKTAGEFDITDRVREAILLELPLKPLCSDDCRGLCPMCGTNLNDNQCDCMPDKADERWDSLKQLF